MGPDRLFEPEWRFRGLEAGAFDSFSIPDREERRRAIITGFHPALERLGEDLIERLTGSGDDPLHAHVPRLDWPPGYQPFCTWLALSSLAHGYQSGPQLNVGVHKEHVSVRLAWDASADAFGRFEFRSRHGGLGRDLAETSREAGLRFRVYASAPWPAGSRLVFESDEDWMRAFDEVRRRGVWWELGRRYELPDALPVVTSTNLGREALHVLEGLLPLYRRIGH